MTHTMFEPMSRDYRRVESIIHWLDEHHPDQPGLKDIAASAVCFALTMGVGQACRRRGH